MVPPRTLKVALFSVEASARITNPASATVAIAVATTLLVGTIQWYLLGGVVGLLLERFWSGLKTAQDRQGDWFQ